MRNLNSVPSLFSKIRTLTTIRRDATKPLSTLLPKAGNAINHFESTEKQVCCKDYAVKANVLVEYGVVDWVIKRSTSSRWLSSLECQKRKSDPMTIRLHTPIYLIWLKLTEFVRASLASVNSSLVNFNFISAASVLYRRQEFNCKQFKFQSAFPGFQKVYSMGKPASSFNSQSKSFSFSEMPR